MTGRRVQAGEVALHITETGDGPPVLAIHGWPQDSRMWAKVTPLLAPHHRVIAVDLRGFGRSEAPTDGYDGPTFVGDMLGLLDALEVDRVRVLGHDWGGHVAFLLAALHPERVERLMVLDAPHLWTRITPRGALGMWRSWYAVANAAHPRLAGSESWTRLVLRLTGGRHATRGAAPGRAVCDLYRYYLAVATRALRPGEPVPHLTVPARLLYGTRERMLPPALLAQPAPASDYAVEAVPGAGHFLPEERPELVAQRALEFFAAG